ncbi:hypothetical protein Dimus_027537 [Dionaea muscipula]
MAAVVDCIIIIIVDNGRRSSGVATAKGGDRRGWLWRQSRSSPRTTGAAASDGRGSACRRLPGSSRRSAYAFGWQALHGARRTRWWRWCYSSAPRRRLDVAVLVSASGVARLAR